MVKVPSGQTIRATVPQRLGPGRSFTVVAPAAPVAAPAAVPSGLAVELSDLAPRSGLTPITDAEMAAVESGGGSEVDGW